MDALDVHETNEFRPQVPPSPARCTPAAMDGHTVMLLGAAKYLAETRNFDGTVHFIFQPAEENERRRPGDGRGGTVRQVPLRGAVYGMHNIPGIPIGRFAVRPGPMMAAYDIFEVVVKGVGAHGAMPHHGIDPVVVGLAHRHGAAVDRGPQRSIRWTPQWFSTTQNPCRRHLECHPAGMHAARHRPHLQEAGAGHDRKSRSRGSRRNVGSGFSGGREVIKWRYERRYPATVNSEKGKPSSPPRRRRRWLVWRTSNRNPTPAMGSEDFAWMLLKRAGLLHLDRQRRRRRQLHGPQSRLRLQRRGSCRSGASYWATLVRANSSRRQALPQARGVGCRQLPWAGGPCRRPDNPYFKARIGPRDHPRQAARPWRRHSGRVLGGRDRRRAG